MSKSLFLGKSVQPGGGLDSNPFHLDGDGLVTHGVVLGMTGSGKTGLSMTLLEELTLAGVPLVLIDPKGDLPNLGLLFPDFSPNSFEAWVDPQEAQRQGKSPAELAAQASSQQKERLAQWDLDGARIEQLRSKMDLRIYTPGSKAGTPVNLLGSFACPSSEVLEQAESKADLIGGTVAGLLSLVGVVADPLRSPEHIVLSQILEKAWSEGEDLSLETLISRLVDPPFKKVGVFPLDTFYPSDKRMELAMRLNSVLASSSFALWAQGDPISPSDLCTPKDGRVPVSIFYLAHLSDQERMFFVALLLEKLLAYTRTLSGTTALRSLLYFDEVAGYIPPTANPASKRPLITLMKQSRAVGFGLVLATQNPVDIDYKGLSNAGTWMIGRMQMTQDRERVADGLTSAEAGFDRAALMEHFEKLQARIFLVKAPGQPKPTLVHTRQAMAFLRGPLTRADLERLSLPKAPERQVAGPASSGASQDGLSRVPPICPEGFTQRYLDPRVVFSAQLENAFENFAEPARSDGKIRMRPALLAEMHVRFDEDRGGFVHDQHLFRVFFPIDEGLKSAFNLDLQSGDLLDTAPSESLFEGLPTSLDEPQELKAAQKAVVDETFRNVTSSQFIHAGLKLYGSGGQSREEFEAVVEAAIQERIDAQVAKLNDRVQKEVASLQDKIEKHQAKVSQLESQTQGRQMEQIWNAGAALLGFFTGSKKSVASAVGTAMTKNRLRSQSAQRSESAGNELERMQAKLDEIQEKLEADVAAIEEKERAAQVNIEEKAVRLETSDIRLAHFGILWIPVSRRV